MKQTCSNQLLGKLVTVTWKTGLLISSYVALNYEHAQHKQPPASELGLPDVFRKNTGHFVNTGRSRMHSYLIALVSRITFINKNEFWQFIFRVIFFTIS